MAFSHIFPDCVATEGVGVELCSPDVAFTSATVRNLSQPSAIVRNRSHEGRMAVPMGSFAKGVTFGGFQHGVASFRVAGVALRCIPPCFMMCQKSFCAAGAILLRCFQTMRRMQAQHFRRVVLRVF